LIFDEVITGFRVGPGGAQEYFGVKADLGTYGKIVGGGMPIGVIAGKREYMDTLDGGFWQYGDNSVPEVGVTYFAGTFVRHPFVLAAAKASLLHMKQAGPALQQGLTALTNFLADKVNTYCNNQNIPFHIAHFASLFKPKYEKEMSNIDLLYFLMRFKGVHLYDGFPCFLTEAHTKSDVEYVANIFIESLSELVKMGFIPGASAIMNGEAGNHHTNGNGHTKRNLVDVMPPMEGARLGKNPDGSSDWFIPDPNRPGKFLKIQDN
jgi:glutamate-1-semialdehyde aminotransferase